jgi:hypothetical protein
MLLVVMVVAGENGGLGDGLTQLCWMNLPRASEQPRQNPCKSRGLLDEEEEEEEEDWSSKNPEIPHPTSS